MIFRKLFQQSPVEATATTIEKSHGRIEKRSCRVITDMDWISENKNWKNIQFLIMMEAERTIISIGQIQKNSLLYLQLAKPG